MLEGHSIHLVSKFPRKCQSLDPADMAASVLQTVRECAATLDDFRDYHDAVVADMSAQLKALELVALRAITPKVGRS